MQKVYHKEAKALFILSIAIVIVSGSVFIMSWLLSRNHTASHILSKTSFEERAFLTNLVEELFYSSTFGYTLFGDKPMSHVSVSQRHGRDRRFFFLELSIPHLKNYENYLNTPHFLLLIEENVEELSLYLINKQAFCSIVRQNIHVFKAILGDKVTAESLLQTIESKKRTVEKALNNSHLLFGILFGYGTENAKLFDRYCTLKKAQAALEYAPKALPYATGEMSLDDIVMHYLQHGDQQEPVPDQNYSADELSAIENKLSRIGGHGTPISINLPSFAGDSESDETQKLVEKYEAQRVFIKSVLKEEDILKTVLEKYYE